MPLEDHRPEIDRPDIACYQQGNSGIDYVYSFTSDRPGPHLWVNSLTHGDEICGAIAVDFILRNWRGPNRGRVTLSFSNVLAYANTVENGRLGTRYVDEDMNRVWDRLDSNESSVELERARSLRPIADTADYLLDIHSTDYPSEPLTIVGLLGNKKKVDDGRLLAQKLGYPTLLVADQGHTAGVRLRDYGRFSSTDSESTALVVECGASWQASSVRVAIEASLSFLGVFDCIDRDEFKVPRNVEKKKPFRMVEVTSSVTIDFSDFEFTMPLRGDEVIPNAGTQIALQGGLPITTPHDDCFIMYPAKQIVVGETAVRFGRMSSLE